MMTPVLMMIWWLRTIMRYNNNKILNDDNGVEYLNRSEYPVIPIRDSDIIINGKFGQDLTNEIL